MEKATVLISSGYKKRIEKAHEIASFKFKPNEIEEISAFGLRFIPRYFFQTCKPHTKCVIIDDISSFKLFHSLVVDCVSRTRIRVEKQGQKPFYISPEVIITCENKIGSIIKRNLDDELPRLYVPVDLSKDIQLNFQTSIV